MQLFYSATSPYVRKVMACAIHRGIADRIETTPSNPHASPADLLARNPLSKVPCLVTDDGVPLFGSQLICEFLDTAVPCRGELGRPKEAARDAVIARYKAAMLRACDVLESDPPGTQVDIGSIAVACALGYMDFRYASDPWRPGRPRLAAWYEAFSANPCIAQTAPKE